MKRLLLLIFLSSMAVSSFGQFYETDTVPLSAGKELIVASRSMAGGFALSVGGLALYSKASILVNEGTKTYADNIKAIEFIGLGLAVAGVAVSVSGYVRIGKAGKKLDLFMKNNQVGVAMKL